MTELAYLADMSAAYVWSFRARIVALPPGGVVLDRTYFYPAGGGQPADHGSLRVGDATVEVVDVTRSGNAVHHRIRGSGSNSRGFSSGAELDGTVDWERRHQNMRLHTAQHLLSARTFERAGLRTTKAVLRGMDATIDLEATLAPEFLPELAQDIEGVVGAARPVTIRHVPRGEWDLLPSAGRSGLVPLPPQVDPVRVVEVEGADSCPCGGTHVRSTAEIGEIRMMAPFLLPSGGTRIGLTLVRPGATVPPA
ncbi:MAG: alanyl-tRNA editing protein [Thermoplasmata archaeon]|nr:alanyl-tRNA editing protein [Thermoplasmata archaeon]